VLLLGGSRRGIGRFRGRGLAVEAGVAGAEERGEV
jgi:hypothetical protein